MVSITNSFYEFLEYLNKNNEKISSLQLTGKIEDYLVKEFVYFIYKKSGGKNFVLVNIGNKNQQKIDLCLIKGNDSEKAEIFGLIEAKYIRNNHRIWDNSAMDEITTILNDLHRQLHIFNTLNHGGFNVHLISKTNTIYGLVFASFVSKTKNDPKKINFYDAILNKAGANFRYHDLKKPYFRPIYEDIQVTILNTKFYVTLKAGFWKRK